MIIIMENNELILLDNIAYFNQNYVQRNCCRKYFNPYADRFYGTDYSMCKPQARISVLFLLSESNQKQIMCLKHSGLHVNFY